MKRLNSKFRGKNSTTDVLSFPLAENFERHLGDIVISLPQARKQAREFGSRLQEELLRLLIHGLLHLLGYDHEGVSKREALRTERKERELFQLILTEQ